MKRAIAVFLAAMMTAVMLPVAAMAAGFNVPELAGFTVAGNETMTYSVESKNRVAVQRLEKILNSAAAPAVKPKDPNYVANLTLELPSGNTIMYKIYNDGGNMYAEQGPRFMQISAGDFDRLMGGFRRFYIYRPIPRLTLRDSRDHVTETSIAANNYNYKKLDGKFYRPGFTQPAIEHMLDISQPWPELEFRITPARPSAVTVTVANDTGTVFTGTWEQAGDYIKKNPGVYGVNVKADFKHDLYNGSVTYTFSTFRA